MINPLNSASRLSSEFSEPLFSVEVFDEQTKQTLSFADPNATRAMVALMDMEATIGGAASHYGGPAAFAEINASLFKLFTDASQTLRRPWTDLYHWVNDAGHCENGLYALKANYCAAGLTLEKLKHFRSIQSPLTGHGEAHLFPEGVLISNGPLGSALAQAQGLSMGDCLQKSDRTTVTLISDGASMEGEAREAFASIPGLAAHGLLNPFVMVISDNNTKLSGRIDKDSFSMQGTFEALSSLGWKVLKLESGNSLLESYRVLKSALAEAQKNPRVPVAVWAKTIKGVGTAQTSQSASGGHGFPLKDPSRLQEFLAEIYGGKAVPKILVNWCADIESRFAKKNAESVVSKWPVREKIQVGVAKALIGARRAGLPVVSVTSDLPGSTGVDAFRKECPEAQFDVGVAESNMVSVAAGLAKSGYIPVVDTFAQFGTTKGALPLIMANLSQAPIIAFYSHIGFQDAADGASHQSLSYYAMTSAIPHTDIYTLSCSTEAEALVGKVLQNFAEDMKNGRTPNSVVFFLGREDFPRSYVEAPVYSLNKAQIFKELNQKNQVVIVATGSLLIEAFLAVDALKAEGHKVTLIHQSSFHQIDIPAISAELAEADGCLVVVEDHQKSGGFGSHLVRTLVENKVSLKLRHLAVDNSFGRSAYQAAQLYAQFEIGHKSIYKAAKELMKER